MRGLGRCVMFLESCTDRQPYLPSVLNVCLNNPAFDTQSEGTRAEYVYRLASLFGDDDYFVTRITEKLYNTLDDSGWEFAHLYDLTEQFALNGNPKAEKALKDAYGRLYGILLNRSELDGYDGARDGFERACISFAHRYGAPAYERIIADLGGLFLQNERYGAQDFDWFIFCLYNDFKRSDVQRFLKDTSRTSAAVRAFREQVERVRKEADNLKKTVREKASARKSEEKKTDEQSAEQRDKERGLALKMLADGENTAEALSMLIRNFKPRDRKILIDSLNKMEIDFDDESGWHGVTYDILHCFYKKVKLPREALEFIYERSLCSFCRESAVRAMGRRGWLTDEMKRECLYDSNTDIIAYAKRFFK